MRAVSGWVQRSVRGLTNDNMCVGARDGDGAGAVVKHVRWVPEATTCARPVAAEVVVLLPRT